MRNAALALLAGAAFGAAGPSTAAERAAEPSALAERSLLLGLSGAGGTIVAVGERGHVLRSEDGGATFTQAEAVPAQVLLTAAYLLDASRGWAVGHDETILATSDGGRTWTRQHVAPDPGDPLLDVWFADASNGVAVGAYSRYLVTSDGGATWARRDLEPTPLVAAQAGPKAGADEEFDEYDVPPEYHYNRIVAAADRLYIAAEAGKLFRSDDRGATWKSLPSPYDGSLFGLLPLDGDSLLAFGLRGNLFRTDDAGLTWQRLDTGTVALLTDGVRLDDGTIVVVGLSGAVLVSKDGGRTFALRARDDRLGIQGVVAGPRGDVVVAGEGGVRVITP
jgi:photosystem II stability/assembly factor-like uncharacterized protein